MSPDQVHLPDARRAEDELLARFGDDVAHVAAAEVDDRQLQLRDAGTAVAVVAGLPFPRARLTANRVEEDLEVHQTEPDPAANAEHLAVVDRGLGLEERHVEVRGQVLDEPAGLVQVGVGHGRGVSGRAAHLDPRLVAPRRDGIGRLQRAVLPAQTDRRLRGESAGDPGARVLHDAGIGVRKGGGVLQRGVGGGAGTRDGETLLRLVDPALAPRRARERAEQVESLALLRLEARRFHRVGERLDDDLVTAAKVGPFALIDDRRQTDFAALGDRPVIDLVQVVRRRVEVHVVPLRRS